MSEVPGDWKKAAVAITPGFEVEGDPYEGVSGNFDGMGISCGALQWNIGSGSLQPMVKNVGKTRVTAAMPTFGNDLWTACNTTIAKGLAIVNGWQTGSTLKAKARAEFKTFMGTPEMRAEQDKLIDKVARQAMSEAEKWATARGTPATKRLFCWFFDIITQNGGLKGLTFKEVSDFIKLNQPDKADDVVCDFLAGKTGTSGHEKDARENAKLWRNNAPGEKLEILVMSYLRSNLALAKWRHVVLNRKGTIAIGSGRVNSGTFNFAEHGL